MYAAKIDLLFESALLLAAVCFSLSVYVFSKAVANKLNLAYGALTFCISLWAFSFFVANVLEWRLMESVHILSTLFLPPLSLLFLHVLLRPEGRIFPWIHRLSWAACLLLFFPVVFGLDRTSWIRDLAYFSPTLIVVANLYLLISELVGGVRPRGGWGDFSPFSSMEMRSTLKRRNFWLYLGGALVTLLCAMDHVPWMGRVLPSIGLLLLALYFFFIKEAVLHQSLVSSRRILAKLLANGIGAAIIFLAFVLMTTWVKGNNALFLTNAFFAAFVAVWILDPIRSLVSIFFQGLFLKEIPQINSLIQNASKEIAGAFHAQAIAAATEKFLIAALDAPLVSFYALDSEGKRYVKIQDSSLALPESLPASFPLVQFFGKAKTWMPALSMELERSAERETLPSKVAFTHLVQESLQSLGSTLAFPFVHHKSILGFATVNLREPPEHWDSSWGSLTLLAPYFERAGEGLQELEVYARLRERDRLATVGEMAAGLAHEIRNPLSAIKGAAQVIEPKKDDPNEPFLKIIVEEVNRLNLVVSQFLNYAKPYRGESEWGDLRQLVLQLGASFQKRCEQASVHLDISATHPPQVKCQPHLIRLVISNLLENSLHALEGKTGKKNVSLRLQHTSGEKSVEVSVSVEDNGPGMTPEVLDKIFIPFFTQSPQGTGLGLPICQKIAEAHGGRMEASSVPGEGTLMTLRFYAEGKE